MTRTVSPIRSAFGNHADDASCLWLRTSSLRDIPPTAAAREERRGESDAITRSHSLSPPADCNFSSLQSAVCSLRRQSNGNGSGNNNDKKKRQTCNDHSPFAVVHLLPCDWRLSSLLGLRISSRDLSRRVEDPLSWLLAASAKHSEGLTETNLPLSWAT